MIKKNNILTFENLSHVEGLVHGFSTRAFGSMRPSDNGYETHLKLFLEALGIPRQSLVRMHQVHSNTVTWVNTSDLGKKKEQTDGLLTEQKNVFLGVITGDCIPLLLYDKEKHFIGAVHAGWRGVYNEIVTETIRAMIIKGSNPEDILVGIGPSIRVCCYEFGKGDAQKFVTKFPQWHDVVVEKKGKTYLDTQVLVKHQLHELGVLPENIEDAEHCTFDKNDDVYSYRKEGKGFGEFIGIIGRK